MEYGRLPLSFVTIEKIHESISELQSVLHSDRKLTEKLVINSHNDEVYHYTSTKVFDSILENAKFWASNIHYLNDAEEYYRGISHLLDIFDGSKYDSILKALKAIYFENGSSSEGIFTISFSSQEDNLHQWITYSKEAGVCIGLDYTLLKDKYDLVYDAVCGKERSIEVYGTCANVLIQANYIEPITNKEKIQKKIINSLAAVFKDAFGSSELNSIRKNIRANKLSIGQFDTAKQFFRLYASYFKNPAFSIENEFRAAFLPLFTKHQACAEIGYLGMLSGVIRPYIKIGVLRHGSTDRTSPLPIKSITIGPAGNQQTVFNSVVHRIKYGKCRVWDYWKHRKVGDNDDPFWNNFINYVCGAIRLSISKQPYVIEENDITIITNKLWEQWCSDNGFDSKVKPIDLGKRTTKEIKMAISLNNGSPSVGDERIKSLIREISENNYFSKEGIWVKKSQIAYVF